MSDIKIDINRVKSELETAFEYDFDCEVWTDDQIVMMEEIIQTCETIANEPKTSKSNCDIKCVSNSLLTKRLKETNEVLRSSLNYTTSPNDDTMIHKMCDNIEANDKLLS